MTQSMIRRTLKNLVQNFSEAEVKVREATSNDPWGPSSSQMSDISDLTYNVVACNEILAMLWKRLNDDKNWRHVYKSLTLLEYLLKTGSDRIPKQCQENIHIVKPLVEYRYTDKDGKDQCVNVREKAKLVMALIEDEQKRKEEREFAMKTKDKLATASTNSSDKTKAEIPPYSGLPSLDNIPSVADLTAAMAKKKEEQRAMEEKKKEEDRLAKQGDAEPDLWEQAATTAPTSNSDPWGAPSDVPKDTDSATNDPWGAPSEDSKDSGLAPSDQWEESVDSVKDVAPNDPWSASTDVEKPSPSAKNDPWGDAAEPKEDKGPSNNDPWGTGDDLGADLQPEKTDPWGAPKDSVEGASSDPWGTPSAATVAKSDPWAGDNGTPGDNGTSTDPFADGAKPDNDPWDTLASAPISSNDPWGTTSPPNAAATAADPFGDGGSSDAWGAPAESNVVSSEDSKNTAGFFGDGASLVDLDNLMSVRPKPTQPPLNAMATNSQKAQGVPLLPRLRSEAYLPFPSTLNAYSFAPITSPSTAFINLALVPQVHDIATTPQQTGLSRLPLLELSVARPDMKSGMMQPSNINPGNPGQSLSVCSTRSVKSKGVEDNIFWS